jgi:para-aminobenzoate synthetase / 4-amino-4-deoxychorismate lyase
LYSQTFPFTEKSVISLIAPLLESPFVFLESSSHGDNQRSFLFYDFEDILILRANDNPDNFFERVRAALKSGFWLSGFFSYESGYLFEDSLRDIYREDKESILIWLGLSRAPLIVDHNFKYQTQSSESDLDLSYNLKNLKPNIDKSEYQSAIAKIKKYIERGLTYQVNYTFKYKFGFKGSALGLYLNLRRNQPTAYSAFINTGKSGIISLSPELFFKISQDKITTKPMKGTVSRGLLSSEDKDKADWLSKDIKNRAENLMIVDLLRNDLGRVSKAGSVKVRELFKVESYRTLHQMVSTVEGSLKREPDYRELFSSLFPSGSVTGAPKISTMKIIRELEKEPRRIYTGSVGYISPDREACFNVAIRTIFLERDRAEIGIGGGITYDSLESSEYNEAILKAGFLKEDLSSFKLIETIAWDPGEGYSFLQEHIERISDSAEYFQISFDLENLKERLELLKDSFKENNRYRVRLTIDIEGNIGLEHEPFKETLLPVKVKMSPSLIDPENIYLYHKTSKRSFYDRERAEALKEGFFDIIYFNNRAELTEGAISNIFLSIEGELYTPFLRSGLLPGILRARLLNSFKAYERVLTLKDLKSCDKIFIGNSLRGLLEAELKLD